MQNRQWILKQRPEGAPSAADLEMRETPVRNLADGEILVRNLFLSLDPTNRLWMSDREQYLPPVGIGDVMRGGTVGIVELSRSERFAVGDIVLPSNGGWELYSIVGERGTRRLTASNDVPLTAHLSVLGATGLTAYFGMLDICRPKEGEILAVSAAAGAVGSIAGQIGLIKGAEVVGIAGSADKCNWLTEELGFTAAIDYRAEHVGGALDRLFPQGIDMNFENVGGQIMDSVFSRLRKNGRMALCGMISSYNQEGPMTGPTDFGRILMQRLTVRGFIVIDYLKQVPEALAELSGWIADGRIQWKDHVVEGLDSAVGALDLLFSGKHDGKLVVRVSPQP